MRRNTRESSFSFVFSTALAHPSAVTSSLPPSHSLSFFSGTEATPADVVPRLHTIVRAATLSPSSCVLDIGTGTGVLLPYFKEEGGVEEGQVVGVDVSSGMLAVARKRFPRAEFWEGDVLDFAEAWLKGRGANGELFDAVFFNACFGNVYDQERALREVGRVMGREGRVVISHPLGAAFVDELKRRSPSVVLKSLPKDEGEWKVGMKGGREKGRKGWREGGRGKETCT